MEFQTKEHTYKRNHIQLEKENPPKDKEYNTLRTLHIPKIPYENHITDEIEAHNINSNNNLYNNIINYTINTSIYKLKNFKIIIPKNNFHRLDVEKDRNCFFRALGKFFRVLKRNIYILEILNIII